MSRHVAYSLAFLITMLYPFICTFFIFNGFSGSADAGAYEHSGFILVTRCIFGL
jgi:hypothetical protein